jgi:hypothetical protein
MASTQQIIEAVCDLADTHGRTITLSEEIGADRTSQSSLRSPTEATWEESLVHEAHLTVAGSPTFAISIYEHDDVLVEIDGIPFEDVPKDTVPLLVRAVLEDRAHLHTTSLLRGQKVVVELHPGGPTLTRLLERPDLGTPWLRRLPTR